VDFAAHTLAVLARVRLVPPAADRLVFNLNPLQAAAFAQSLQVHLNGAAVEPTTEGVWLSVPLPPGTALAGPLALDFAYTLALSPIHPGAWGWRGTLGWTTRQHTLGDWFPVLAPYDPGSGWLTPSPAPLGEYATTPFSDFEVTLEVTGNTRPVLVAGSGQPRPCAALACFDLPGARYPAYVLSEIMLSQTITTTTGVSVTSVYMPEHAAAGQAALAAAAAALEAYSDLFGLYPFTTFVQVEGDFYDGMEYSGLSFVGAGYYAEYDGSPNNLLTTISAHEAAHQWWHTLVGNDPAHEPWLDEALCTYAELLFYERHHPDSVPWWWAFRVQWFAPSGSVGATIYDHAGFRGYVDSVYLNGAQMLHRMRQSLGDERFLAFLRAYTAENAGLIARPPYFWSAYASAGGDPAAIQAEYFSSP
jgi:hypothetical protein